MAPPGSLAAQEKESLLEQKEALEAQLGAAKAAASASASEAEQAQQALLQVRKACHWWRCIAQCWCRWWGTCRWSLHRTAQRCCTRAPAAQQEQQHGRQPTVVDWSLLCTLQAQGELEEGLLAARSEAAATAEEAARGQRALQEVRRGGGGMCIANCRE